MKKTEIIDLDDLENPPSKRYGHTSVIVGDCLFLFGGASLDGKDFLNDLNIFNLVSLKWEETIVAEGIDGRNFHTCVPTSEEQNVRLIFFGGKSNGYKNDVFIYEIESKKFVVMEPRFKNNEKISSCVNNGMRPPTARYGHSMTYHDEKVFIFGGYDKVSKKGIFLDGLTKFVNFFSAKKRMPSPRMISIPFLYRRTCGKRGVTSSNVALNDVYRFDLGSDSTDDDHGVEAFELTIENPVASYGHKCFILDEKIYMFGGRDRKKEFRHLLRLEHGEGNLRWVVEEGSFIDESKLSMSYGSINTFKDKLLFFGGQQKKIKSPEKKEEEEGEEEEEIYDIISDKLPFDTIFEILSYLRKMDQVSVCGTSKNWSFSVAARSDRIWLPRYEEERVFCGISNYQMKKVKRRKTCFEKYKLMKHLMRLHRIQKEKNRLARQRKQRKKQDKQYMKYRKSGLKEKEKHNKARIARSNKEDLKLVLNGDGAVGKTCLLIVYASEDHRFPTEYVPTVFDNYTATVSYKDKDIGLGLWDTAGEEDYDELRPLSYVNTDLFVICFSCVNPVSLANVKSKWVREIVRNEPGVPYILCCTKTDLRNDEGILEELRDSNQSPVTKAEGREVAKDIGAIGYYETSAFTGKGVKEFFDACIALSISGEDPETGDKCGIM